VRQKLLLAATLLLATATAGVARAADPASARDDASKHAKVRELFELTSMQTRVDQIRASALGQLHAMAAQQFAAAGLDAQNKSVLAYYDKLNSMVTAKYDWAQLEPKYEQVYVDLYTEEELDGILAFYRSPVGHAFLAKSPEATRQVLQLSKQQLDSLAPQIQQLTNDYLEALKPQSKPQP
jgi:hypothetical protein